MKKDIFNMTLNEIITILEQTTEKYNSSGRTLSEVEQYDTFKLDDTEFIVLEHNGNETMCLTRDFIAENVIFDDETNNFAEAEILNILDEFEVKLAETIGAENIVELEIDLTSDDGLKDYGSLSRKVGLLTDLQYRTHSEGICRYPVNGWWWTATPWSTPKRDIKYSVRVVSDGGRMNFDFCDGNGGVRAVCILKSNIFVS